MIVTNSTYPGDPHQLQELKGPRIDGLHLWSAITDRETGCFETQNVAVCFERTSAEVLEEADEFFGAADIGDVLLFYFSGHGRRHQSDLVLCARDTVSTKLITTGVEAERLRKLMDASMASITIVILDCCHGGGFKGDAIASDFAGTGRFVLAAAGANELARDSDAHGLPSPFTSAICEGLLTAPGSNFLDLDSLYSYTTARLRKSGPLPQRKFSASATRFPIARRLARQVPGPTAPRLTEEAREADTERRPSPSGEIGAPPGETSSKNPFADVLHNRRSRGDIAIGDLRTWLVCLILGLVAAGAAYGGFKTWDKADHYAADGGYTERVDPRSYVCFVVLGLTLLVAALSAMEGLMSRRIGINDSSRRGVVTALNAKWLRVTRRARQTISIAAALPALLSAVGFENYNPTWTISLSAAAALAFIGFSGFLNYGSESLLGGSILMATSTVLPVSSGSHPTVAVSTAPGIFALVCAVALLAGWYFKQPTALLAISLPFSAPLILSGLYGDFGVGSFASLVAAITVLLSMVAGDGRPVNALSSTS
jgi:caspase domain-containing protein